MCLQRIDLGNGFSASCRKCAECLTHRRVDFIARCQAEAVYARSYRMVTLTYGRDRRIGGEADHPHAYMLHYHDVQNYLKRVRLQCSGVRYFVAGEYGPRRGRCHWHLIMFFAGEELSNIHDSVNYMHTVAEKTKVVDLSEFPGEPYYWPHGWSYWSTRDDESAFGYCAKYLTKDLGDGERVIIRQSRKPLLGARYFEEMAKKAVAEQLPIKDLRYTIPGKVYRPKPDRTPGGGIDWKADKPQRRGAILFGMTPACARFYMEAYMAEWKARYGDDRWPQSEVIDDYLDRKAKMDAANWTVREQLEIAVGRKRQSWWNHASDFEWEPSQDEYFTGAVSMPPPPSVEVAGDDDAWEEYSKASGGW